MIDAKAHSTREKSISNGGRVTKQTYPIKICVSLIDHQHFNHGIIHSTLPNKRQEADIIRRTRFFHAVDNRASDEVW